MIFNNNTTALGASNIPMAEGYDCSYGAALALVETARNDYAMFKAMLEADYREISICKESTEGYVQEAEIQALTEAVGGGIFKKIAELFKKLIAKIKSIFHTLISKIDGIAMSDTKLLNKYRKEVLTKKNINKLEVKWRKFLRDDIDKLSKDLLVDIDFNENDALNNWDEDDEKRLQHYMHSSFKNGADSVSEYRQNIIEDVLDDEDTYEIGDKEVGGIASIIATISGFKKTNTELGRKLKTATSELSKIVKKYEKKVVESSKNESALLEDSTTANMLRNNLSNPDNEPVPNINSLGNAGTSLEDAKKQYDMAIAYQSVLLTNINVVIEIITIQYKQAKAAFMKAVAVNPKKLEESMIYAEAVAEAAEQEVDDVISQALTSEQISNICAASKNVKDEGVIDSADALTYGYGYKANSAYSPTKCKNEAALFGKMFY